MAELADAQDSGSCIARCAGSTPVSRNPQSPRKTAVFRGFFVEGRDPNRTYAGDARPADDRALIQAVVKYDVGGFDPPDQRIARVAVSGCVALRAVLEGFHVPPNFATLSA